MNYFGASLGYFGAPFGFVGAFGGVPGTQPGPMHHGVSFQNAQSIYGSMPSVPSMYSSAQMAPTASKPSIYSSMVNVPAASSSLYSSQVAAPSIYASMPSVPSAPPAAVQKKAPAGDEDEIPSLPEGFSTVGILIWPDNTSGSLLITGFMEGYSAENCELETGDEIINVNDTPVHGMEASDVAVKLMAGPSGSSVTITTSRTSKEDPAKTTTHTVMLTRDVSSEDANKKTRESIESTKPKPVPLTPHECMMYGMPMGATWSGSKSKPKSPVKAQPAPKTSPAKGQGNFRMLSPAECLQYGVPFGARIMG